MFKKVGTYVLVSLSLYPFPFCPSLSYPPVRVQRWKVCWIQLDSWMEDDWEVAKAQYHMLGNLVLKLNACKELGVDYGIQTVWDRASVAWEMGTKILIHASKNLRVWIFEAVA
jgi:hypothetical protein